MSQWLMECNLPRMLKGKQRSEQGAMPAHRPPSWVHDIAIPEYVAAGF
jgi:hypothetical protein